ncbi:hypothetical protein ROI_41220 [Roseburia intestinalis M50/1]|nr:hypothetical protein ROI_41220 [Roseburia intestinalis M50/1]
MSEKNAVPICTKVLYYQ